MSKPDVKRPRTIYKKVQDGLMWFENRHITLGTVFMAYPEKIEACHKKFLQVVGIENVNTIETTGRGFHLTSYKKRENEIPKGKVGIQRVGSKPREKIVIESPIRVFQKIETKNKNERPEPKAQLLPNKPVKTAINRNTDPKINIEKVNIERPDPKNKTERKFTPGNVPNNKTRENVRRIRVRNETPANEKQHGPNRELHRPIRIPKIREKQQLYDLYRTPYITKEEEQIYVARVRQRREKRIIEITNPTEQLNADQVLEDRYSLTLRIEDMEVYGVSKHRIPPEKPQIGKEVGIGVMDKHEILAQMHHLYNPEIYFEIGVDAGVSIRLATRTAIGVDPKPHIGGNVNAAEIHEMTSDAFFEQNLLKGRKPDLVFIDGLHTFDQVIRDFRNVERNVKDTTIVVIDDILPTHNLQTSREWKEGMWTGDVWKFVPIIKKYRPDLTITMLDSYPTGLMIITGFDPNNNVLWDKYNLIVREYMNAPVPDYIYKRENMDLRKDIDFAIRNLLKIQGVKILCYVNHYFNPKPTGADFVGGCTGEAEYRKNNVKKCLQVLRSIKGCDVKVCGIKENSLVPIDIDFTGINPQHIPYASLNLMRTKAEQYDYVLNIEDDILISSNVLSNCIEFEKTAESNEIFLPNRLEQRGDSWDCVDLRSMTGWTKNKKRWHNLLLREAVNCHSGMLFMGAQKFIKGTACLDTSFRKQFHGGFMASAYAYFHSAFILYRNPYPNKFHSVWHLDKWIRPDDRKYNKEAKLHPRMLTNYFETKIPYGLNGDISGAYNMAMAASNAEWVLLLDQDVFLCNPFWYQICLDAINTTPLNTGLITCMCNPLHGADKRTSEEAQQAEIEIRSTNIEDHIRVAEKLYNKYKSTVQPVTTYKLAGYFMLVKKSIWEAVKFRSIGTGVLGTDWNYGKMLLSYGYKIYRMPGLYVYHRRGLRSLNWKLQNVS